MATPTIKLNNGVEIPAVGLGVFCHLFFHIQADAGVLLI